MSTRDKAEATTRVRHNAQVTGAQWTLAVHTTPTRSGNVAVSIVSPCACVRVHGAPVQLPDTIEVKKARIVH